MSTNTSHLSFHFSDLAQIAIVQTTKDGIAKTVQHYTQTISVYAQATHIGFLKAGDEILFLESNKGPYIIARTFYTEPLTILHHRNARIMINPQGDICLSTSKATLRLTQTGEIELTGVNLSQRSQKDIRIQAKRDIHIDNG